jgi:hypothetical protein
LIGLCEITTIVIPSSGRDPFMTLSTLSQNVTFLGLSRTWLRWSRPGLR